MGRICIILMGIKVTKIQGFGEGEFSPMCHTEEVSEILKSASAAPCVQEAEASCFGDF